MKILTNILKDFIKIPNNLYDITNGYIIEVDDYKVLNESKGLKTGHVLSVNKHPNADTLFVTKVDVGNEVLDIVCGASNVKEGMDVIVATVGAILPGDFLIEETKIRGVESNGMICSLAELGIDTKQMDMENQRGIFHFEKEVPIGVDPLPLIGLDGELLTLDITPNRGDLLSHLGFAYDLAPILKTKVNIPTFNIKESSLKNKVEVSIESEDCFKYDLRVMDVKVKESPWWLKNALINSDIRPINNIVDITNYVLIKYGTPLHAFDYHKVNSSNIVVKSAKDKEKVVTLDEEEREVQKGDILITDGTRPIALGGVMGLLNTIVDDNTTTVMLEAALFNSKQVKATSNRLNLVSDSSLRFERGFDQERVRLGLEAATQLLIELADAKVYKGISSCVKKEENNEFILYNYEETNKDLNITLSKDEHYSILKSLNYEIDIEKDLVKAPNYRKDIKIKEDVTEEIARIYGFDNIKLEPLYLTQTGKLSTMQKAIRKIRYLLSGLGLNEVINYSLISKEESTSFSDYEYKTVLKPMRPDRVVLRTSLIPGLINNVNYHVSRSINDLSFYEIGHLFKEKEENYLGVIMHGNYLPSNWGHKPVKTDFYVLKGILNHLEESFNTTFKLVKENNPLGYHPGISASIYHEDKLIGQMGKIHPEVLKDKDIIDLYGFEINLNFINSLNNKLIYKPISKYPSIKRDISFIISKEHSIEDILSLINQTGKKLITDVNLFDIYDGNLVDENKQSLAVSITFNNMNKTMEKEEADSIIKSIKFRLSKTFKAVIRD